MPRSMLYIFCYKTKLFYIIFFSLRINLMSNFDTNIFLTGSSDAGGIKIRVKLFTLFLQCSYCKIANEP